MTFSRRLSSLGLPLVVLALQATPLSAQIIDLTVNDAGLAIGDKPDVRGLRINFRDRELHRVDGVNITIWNPYEPMTGTVRGLALGVPATGAANVEGALVGVFGGGVSNSLTGLGLGGMGVGGGGSLKGVMVGGVGVGAGGNVSGITVGGVGIGAGGNVSGISFGGVGIGSGGRVSGLALGVVGVGAGGGFEGIGIGGVGVGSGGDSRGVLIGGVGVGSGGNATGFMFGGVGVGSGGTLKGLSIGGIGVGAPELKGVAIGGVGVGAAQAKAIVLATAFFKITKDGRFDGGALSAFNNIQGAQHGLTIGLLNYARELHGAQFGVINVSKNDGRVRVFPLLSVR